ncbi:MAG: translation initiation factor IF-2 subunit gamma [Thermoplasmata archaeon]
MKVPVQPEANIGMIGHVDHGKTTLTKMLTGEWTDRHSEEIKRGISIRLGYADASIYKCPDCPEPMCYSIEPECPECGTKGEFLRAISFVDSPGHETLMATMLSGAALMDGALLLIAANEICPQPQTKEHVMGLSITGVENIVIVQNKIDIVDEEKNLENYEEILSFIEGTIAQGSPVIPLSAHHNANTDALIMEMEKRIPTAERDLDAPPKMYVARSFDINVPGTPPKKLQGGVIGGSLIQGKISVGDEIFIAPGIKGEISGKTVWDPIESVVTSLVSGGEIRDEVGPGGLIAVGTELDPALVKSDSLTGRVAGAEDALPDVLDTLTLEINLLERVVGAAEELDVDNIKTNEPLMLNVGTATTVGIVTSAREQISDISLKIPVSAEKGQRTAISRRIDGRWRLIGYGIIQ